MNGILMIWVTQFTHTIILQATGRTLLTFVTSDGMCFPTFYSYVKNGSCARYCLLFDTIKNIVPPNVCHFSKIYSLVYNVNCNMSAQFYNLDSISPKQWVCKLIMFNLFTAVVA